MNVVPPVFKGPKRNTGRDRTPRMEEASERITDVDCVGPRPFVTGSTSRIGGMTVLTLGWLGIDVLAIQKLLAGVDVDGTGV